MIRETTWENPGHEWGSEVAMCGPLALAGRWLPTELPPTSDELWWDIHDIRDVVKLVAGLFDVLCKLHYYFKNYAGTVDCYVHYKEQMSRKWCFEHYSASTSGTQRTITFPRTIAIVAASTTPNGSSLRPERCCELYASYDSRHGSYASSAAWAVHFGIGCYAAAM